MKLNPLHKKTEVRERLLFLDFFRGLAIGAVLMVHCGQSIPNLSRPVLWVSNFGMMGVHLFFIISAFALCLSADYRHEQSWVPFFARRFFRVAPLYYLGIVLYGSMATLSSSIKNGEFNIPEPYNLTSILENLFFVHLIDKRYYNNIVPGGWSISTEMLFYVGFPLLYIIFTKLNFDKPAHRFVMVLLPFLLYCAYLANSWSYMHVEQQEIKNIISQFEMIILSAISFLFGFYCYKLHNRVRLNSPLWLTLSLSLLAASVVILNTESYLPQRGFLYVALSTLAFSIAILFFSTRRMDDHFFVQGIAKVGKLSFSMYIFHFILLDLILRLTPFGSVVMIQANPDIQLLLLLGCLVVISFLFATVTNKYIEKVFTAFGSQLISRYFREKQLVAIAENTNFRKDRLT